MSVPIKTEPDFEAGTPVPLFDASLSTWVSISRDGQRFLLSVHDKAAQDMPITIINNWTADLPRQ